MGNLLRAFTAVKAGAGKTPLFGATDINRRLLRFASGGGGSCARWLGNPGPEIVPRVRLAAITIAVVVMALVGCGEKTINSDRAEETVSRVVEEKTGFEPTDMRCPSDVEAKTGGTFECEFTGPEGPYTASVTIADVDGDDATFQVISKRSD